MSLKIEAKNLSAQLHYRAAGNPPSTLPDAAISNAYPGLEMDFRNVWKRILVGIELHESNNIVVAVDADAPPALQQLAEGYRLMQINHVKTTMTVTGPLDGDGPKSVPLKDTTYGLTFMPLEWSNALAEIVHKHSGESVKCIFESISDAEQKLHLSLKVRSFFAETKVGGEKSRQAVIARDIAPPGELTQSLCSPWQNDYRECACFYWAATRPDYVNVEARPDGTSTGQNWMQRDRTPETANVYIVDDWMDLNLLNYTDLFRNWEKSLRFIIGGQDEPLPGEEAKAE